MLEGPASPFELNSGGDAALPRGATAEPLKGRGEGWNENTVEVRILGGSMEDPIRVSGFENHGRISQIPCMPWSNFTWGGRLVGRECRLAAASAGQAFLVLIILTDCNELTWWQSELTLTTVSFGSGGIPCSWFVQYFVSCPLCSNPGCPCINPTLLSLPSVPLPQSAPTVDIPHRASGAGS